ncbi:acyltransferase, partial [Acinetobacter baumannii]|nr:acyltransferase [Acinetobacter baumannii]
IIDNFFNKNLFLLLGKLSFSIYLIHIPIMYIFGIPIFNIFFNQGFNFAASAFISVCISLLFTISLSILYSRYVDDFAIKFSNRLSNLILKK